MTANVLILMNVPLNSITANTCALTPSDHLNANARTDLSKRVSNALTRTNVWTLPTCVVDAVSAETTQVVTIANVLVVTDWTKVADRALMLTSAEVDWPAVLEAARTFPDPSDACAVTDTDQVFTDVDVKTSTNAPEARARWDRCARTQWELSSAVAQVV